MSHYGAMYNFLSFNDGFHQEHHLRPSAHWTTLPEVGRDELYKVERIVSPFPAIVGFLHLRRKLLHRQELV